MACQLTWEKMWERIVADHARWRGRVIETQYLGGGNGNDWCGWMDLPSPVRVTFRDVVIELGDTNEYDDEGGLIETYYPIEECGPFPDFLECPDAMAHWVDGPTYYMDGRIEYPEWWEED